MAISYYARDTRENQTGLVTDYQYSFTGGVPINASHVHIWINDGGGWVEKLKTDATYSWAHNWTNKTISFDSAPGTAAVPVDVRIRRQTPETRITDYESGSALPETDLDIDSKQPLYLFQEQDDSLKDVMRISDVHGKWTASFDDSNTEIREVADGAHNDSVCSVGQCTSIAGGGSSATLNKPFYCIGTGDGLTRNFDLRALAGDNDIYNITPRELLIHVYPLGGKQAYRVPIESYIMLKGYIVGFSNYTPAKKDKIQFVWFPATVAARYEEGLVDTPALQDGSVTTIKIADLNVTTAKIAADAITGAKIVDDAIDSEHYVDGSIDTAHIAALAVTEPKIAAGINKDIAVTDIKTATIPLGTTDELVWEDNSNTGFQNTTDKAIQIVCALSYTGVSENARRYQLEISSASGFATSFILDSIEMGKDSSGPAPTYKTISGLVPDDWYWRVTRVNSAVANNTDVNVDEITRIAFPH